MTSFVPAGKDTNGKIYKIFGAFEAILVTQNGYVAGIIDWIQNDKDGRILSFDIVNKECIPQWKNVHE